MKNRTTKKRITNSINFINVSIGILKIQVKWYNKSFYDSISNSILSLELLM
jgi:hypothetical protein